MRRSLIAVSLLAAAASFAPPAALVPSSSAAEGTTTTVSNEPYPVPTPLTAGKPGALISHEKLTVAIPGTAYRVLYHSKAVDGRDIPVSGLVFVPPGKAPKGGWPLVSFAHG